MGAKTAATKVSSKPAAASGAKVSSQPTRSLLPLVGLQQGIGNAATMRLLQQPVIQPKLTVSHPEDESEREADRVADQVMRMPEPPQDAPGSGNSQTRSAKLSNTAVASRKVQRKCDHCEEEAEEKLQRKEQGRNASNPAAAPAIAHQAFHSMGQPLDSTTRGFFERRFGRDLSEVRVHTGTLQAEAAQSVNALAYTVGSHIVFGKGRYVPGQMEGRRLLAHELAHVVQQSESPSPQLQKFEAPVHESVERYGLTTDSSGKAGGLNQEEATAAYFGNWMRDMNQVLVPMVTKLVGPQNIDVIYAAINYLAFKKFGKSVNAEQFGYYIPAEHIDSPAGIVKDYDLLPAQPNPTVPSAGPAPPKRPSQYVTPQDSTDPKTGDVLGLNIFSVDKSGVMAFILRSNLHVERRLELAVERGRNPEGLMHFGAALHAVEDLFAHSNWIEMAVSKALKDNSKLLPQLKEAERKVFTFSNEVQTPKKGMRPVLTTGSFTGKDTKVSVGSELVAVLQGGLSEPASEAEQAAQAQLTLQMLHATSGRARTDPAFRAAVRKVIVGNLPEFPGRDAVVDQFLMLPMEEIYKVTLLFPHLPQWVKDMLGITEIQNGIRYVISNFVMKPLGRQLQTLALETQVADTSLVKDLEEHKATVAAQQTAAEKAAKQKGTTPKAELKKTDPEARTRLAALEATPEAVLAGPSHSQIAKDHPNSPFFGLAVLLASMAVRSLREKMVAAWDAKAGKATTQYEFAGPPTDPKEKALYDSRKDDATKSFERGKGIVDEGRDISEEGGKMTEESFDLAAMRNESAQEIRFVAALIRIVASAPQKVATVINVIERRLKGQGLKTLASWIQNLRKASTHPTLVKAADALTAHAAALEAIAIDVQGPPGRPPTHDEREAANRRVRNQQSSFLGRVVQDHSIDAAFGAGIFLMLQRQVQSTAVTWTKGQRDVLEGRSHVLDDKLHTLKVDKDIELPSVAGKPAAVQALLKESRRLMGHPYDNEDWWKPTVTQFITKNASQMQSEIEARNAGYLVFRTPGKKESHH